MAQIILQNCSSSLLLQRKITSFGPDISHDIQITTSTRGIAFSIIKEGSEYFLLPGNLKHKINGNTPSRKQILKHCDRIEWPEGVAIFLDTVLPAIDSTESKDALTSLKVLQDLAVSLQKEGSHAVHKAFLAIVEMAGADEGFLLSELKREHEWHLVASKSSEEEIKTRKTFLSNTILKEVIEKRAPVYAESIIGHPFAEAASVIAARVFSVACFPLIVKEELIGAVFLYTRTPGKTIQKSRLPELNLLCTQVALLLALSARSKISPKAENSRLLFDANKSPMNEVQEKIRKLGPTPMNLLVLGETGTGKELVARSLHEESNRKNAPFIAVNCAAIPAALLESTLFGHEKGAFTGAVKSQPGKFQIANSGTLFLDEIGDLPLELQSKLLRVLQDHIVEPVGSHTPQKVDVRIIAATHQNLEQLVAQKKFRQDLFYRLNGAKIMLPALRQRSMDIPLLAEQFLAKSAPQKHFHTDCLRWMQEYPWPGNVRELEQVVTRAAYLSEGNTIQTNNLDIDLTESFVSENEQFWENFESLSEAQTAFTKNLVEKTLQKLQGNRAQTAARLGISERTLYRILSETQNPS